MKHYKLISVALAMLMALPAFAVLPDESNYHFVEASDLTMIGKITDAPEPYARVDTIRYTGWNGSENFQLRTSCGIAVVFKTNSKRIAIKPQYGDTFLTPNASGIAYKGFDLYIRKDGKWLWAGACGPIEGYRGWAMEMVSNMDGSMHECLLYLPLFSEMKSVKIGVDKGSTIEAIPSPFRHRIAIYGSSFTQGVSCGRPGMTYPAIFTRDTGIQLLSLGMSGNCKMQAIAAQVLKDADVEGFIFDTFSNPSLQEIRDRLFPFIETLQSTHPDVPLIFQSTVRRENRNFNVWSEKFESDREHLVDSLMNIACKKYKNVYYIHPNATEDNHEATIDGVHPSNYGYELWAKSIEKKVTKILRKYGIR